VPVEACIHCQGNGKIYKETSPGVWEEVKCPAGCRKGKVNKKLI
jgi:hypothetical protein